MIVVKIGVKVKVKMQEAEKFQIKQESNQIKASFNHLIIKLIAGMIKNLIYYYKKFLMINHFAVIKIIS